MVLFMNSLKKRKKQFFSSNDKAVTSFQTSSLNLGLQWEETWSSHFPSVRALKRAIIFPIIECRFPICEKCL
jgi:hypothetical protein